MTDKLRIKHHYRLWLLAALALWFFLFSLYLSTRPLRRERLRCGFSYHSCDVAEYTASTGKDGHDVTMCLDNIREFHVKKDDWIPISGSLENALAGHLDGEMLAEIFSGYHGHAYQEEMERVTSGYLYFDSEQPQKRHGYTVAVYDADTATLYYIEYCT